MARQISRRLRRVMTPFQQPGGIPGKPTLAATTGPSGFGVTTRSKAVWNWPGWFITVLGHLVCGLGKKKSAAAGCGNRHP